MGEDRPCAAPSFSAQARTPPLDEQARHFWESLLPCEVHEHISDGTSSGHLTDSVTFEDDLQPNDRDSYFVIFAAGQMPRSLQTTRIGMLLPGLVNATKQTCPNDGFRGRHPHHRSGSAMLEFHQRRRVSFELPGATPADVVTAGPSRSARWQPCPGGVAVVALLSGRRAADLPSGWAPSAAAALRSAAGLVVFNVGYASQFEGKRLTGPELAIESVVFSFGSVVDTRYLKCTWQTGATIDWLLDGLVDAAETSETSVQACWQIWEDNHSALDDAANQKPIAAGAAGGQACRLEPGRLQLQFDGQSSSVTVRKMDGVHFHDSSWHQGRGEMLEVRHLEVWMTSLPLLASAGLYFFVDVVWYCLLKSKPAGKDIDAPRRDHLAAQIKPDFTAFLNGEHKYSDIIVIIMASVLLVLYVPVPVTDHCGDNRPRDDDPHVTICVVVEALLSTFACWLGMMVATDGNSRITAACAKGTLDDGLTATCTAVSVMGFTVSSPGLVHLGATLWLRSLHADNESAIQQLPDGDAAQVWLRFRSRPITSFARLAGGVSTQASDVGADLVDEVEANIDGYGPRNSTSITDHGGGNVGDAASSDRSSVLASPSIGVTQPMCAVLYFWFMTLCVVCPVIGYFGASTNPENPDKEALVGTLKKNRHVFAFSSLGLSAVAFYVRFGRALLGWKAYGCILVELLAVALLVKATWHFTSIAYGPVISFNDRSYTVLVTAGIHDLGAGMLGMVPPVTIHCTVILGCSAAVTEYGAAVAPVSMQPTLGITHATDAYSSMANNTGGLAEIASLGSDVRVKTDSLDTLRNTTMLLLNNETLNDLLQRNYDTELPTYTDSNRLLTQIPVIFTAGDEESHLVPAKLLDPVTFACQGCAHRRREQSTNRDSSQTSMTDIGSEGKRGMPTWVRAGQQTLVSYDRETPRHGAIGIPSLHQRAAPPRLECLRSSSLHQCTCDHMTLCHVAQALPKHMCSQPAQQYKRCYAHIARPQHVQGSSSTYELVTVNASGTDVPLAVTFLLPLRGTDRLGFIHATKSIRVAGQEPVEGHNSDGPPVGRTFRVCPP
eukprot:gene1125-216_t